VPATIETDDLSRSFGTHRALDGLTLEAAPGEVLALLGPNGAGKTTAVRLLDGVLAPDRGSCRVLGADPATDGDAVRRRTAVVSESTGLDDRLTPRENLRALARIRGLPLRGTGGRHTAGRIGDLLDRLGMAARADRPLAGASTGERKRVALAAALVHEPDVLFLDEPTSGLDPAASRDVVALVAELAADGGRTVVLCTHLLAEADRLASRVAILAHGRLRAFGAPTDLAARLGGGLPVDLDLGAAPVGPDVVARLGTLPGVQRADPAPAGARMVVDGRDVVAAVVAELVAVGVPVHAAVPRQPTLEDVYFAVQGDGSPGIDTGAVPAGDDDAAGRSGHGPVGSRVTP
jgi:ABC-2 type transport system ATP-binding protein